MNIDVDNNWWKDLFDGIYLQTDARSVCNDTLTVAEVDFLEKTLNLRKSWPILDLCGGQGRHALELARRGFSKITTLDYSYYLIQLGRRKAGQEDLNALFIRGDARCTGLRDEAFRVIVIMGSSFGYFIQEKENQKILNEAFRLLVPKGLLFLDIPNREYLLRHFKSYTRHKVHDDIEVCRTRQLGMNIIYCREKVTSATRGFIREKTYCTRLYSPQRISELLQHAGFFGITFQHNFMCRESDGDYGTMTNRMTVMAEKR
jgi:D-alanine-D-alanine ligase